MCVSTLADVRNPAWYRATTLVERAESLEGKSSEAQPEGVDAVLARKRLERWRSALAFTRQGSSFAERLAQCRLTEDGLASLLGESAERLRDRIGVPPAWLEKLARVYANPASQATLPFSQQALDSSSLGFLFLAEPLIQQGRKELQAGLDKLIERHGPKAFDPFEAEECVFPTLVEQLLLRLGRTLVLELNVARLQGLLEGQTPEERYQSFIARLRRRDVSLAILQEYPVLARELVVSVDQWVASSLEFLRHLCEDYEDITVHLNQGKSLGRLSKLEGGAGDRHRGGRSVQIATFSSGLRLVYKPRSLAVDLHFQELLAWFNQKGFCPPFRLLNTRNRCDHGWVEYVSACGCTSTEQVRRFYERQGGYLALLYSLYATDLHLENLIACGEHPVLVDLEALFHPSPGESGVPHAPSFAATVLNRSVLGTGLLPQRVWTHAERPEGVELSGLGGAAGQMTPHRLPYWEATATDEMRLARKRIEMPGSKNRPTLNGASVDVLSYVEDIVAGFTKAYRLIMEYRRELSGEGGLLDRFAEDEVRYIARATRIYHDRLMESFHPDLLRDALDRDRFFDSLWVSGEVKADLARVFAYEREDLERGDIPVFTTRPGSRDLLGTSGKRIADYLPVPALQLAHRRVRRLDADDMARQAWLVRASFAALTMGEGRTQWPCYDWSCRRTEAKRTQLLSASREIGNRVENLALRGEDGTAWLGLKLLNDKVWSLAPSGADLYDGLSGIALFLGYLGAATGEERYTALAESAVGTLCSMWEQMLPRFLEAGVPDNSRPTIGAFDEVGGTVYSLTHLGALWNRSGLLEKALQIVELLPPLIQTDERYGVLDGAAGSVCVLLALNRCMSSGLLLRTATRCGDHLLARVQRTEQGAGWLSPRDRKPLTGFSHGSAGISYALLELASATGERRFRDAALEAIDYERNVFSSTEQNWPDLRETETIGDQSQMGKDAFSVAWCHGATGIGLSRLGAARHLNDPQIEVEIRLALRKTLDRGFGINHSLCHGALGNLELALRSSEILEDFGLRSETYVIAHGILESIQRQGWLCGVPWGTETPGLMTGLAGIGYGLLRLAEPELVPSVLTLETPPGAARETIPKCAPQAGTGGAASG